MKSASATRPAASTTSAAKATRAPNQTPTKAIHISPSERLWIYANSRNLPSTLTKKCGVQIPFVTYFKDPFVAKEDPAMALDENVFVPWEPGLFDGPTSAMSH